MTAHSPGPWHPHVNAAGDLDICTPDGRVVVKWYESEDCLSPADARLVAAAPELLSVARMAAEEWCGRRRLTRVPCPDPACLQCRAFAIVARIDGKQQDDAKTDK